MVGHRQIQQLRDTSLVYIRGEENLRGWRPRGTSLLLDHEVELERIYRIHEVGLLLCMNLICFSFWNSSTTRLCLSVALLFATTT